MPIDYKYILLKVYCTQRAVYNLNDYHSLSPTFLHPIILLSSVNLICW